MLKLTVQKPTFKKVGQSENNIGLIFMCPFFAMKSINVDISENIMVFGFTYTTDDSMWFCPSYSFPPHLSFAQYTTCYAEKSFSFCFYVLTLCL